MAIAEEGAIGELIDCSEITIDYQDDEELTTDERVAKMEQALYDSLNRFDLCQAIANQVTKQAGGGGNNGEGSHDGGSGHATSTETDGEDTADTESTSSSPQDSTATTTAKKSPAPPSMANGAPPKDISPVTDNDDRLAAQIKLAAELEEDPERKKKLQDEYRKYKGLPVKP